MRKPSGKQALPNFFVCKKIRGLALSGYNNKNKKQAGVLLIFFFFYKAKGATYFFFLFMGLKPWLLCYAKLG
jgi:hypothetical protein